MDFKSYKNGTKYFGIIEGQKFYVGKTKAGKTYIKVNDDFIENHFMKNIQDKSLKDITEDITNNPYNYLHEDNFIPEWEECGDGKYKIRIDNYNIRVGR